MNLGLKEPDQEIVNRKKFMFYPNDRFKNFWEVLVCLCLLSTCILTPFNLAFSEIIEIINWYMNLNYGIDLFFFLDIILNFNSAYNDESYQIIDNRKTIAINYISSWFFVDFLSIIPFEILINYLDF